MSFFHWTQESNLAVSRQWTPLWPQQAKAGVVFALPPSSAAFPKPLVHCQLPEMKVVVGTKPKVDSVSLTTAGSVVAPPLTSRVWVSSSTARFLSTPTSTTLPSHQSSPPPSLPPHAAAILVTFRVKSATRRINTGGPPQVPPKLSRTPPPVLQQLLWLPVNF